MAVVSGDSRHPDFRGRDDLERTACQFDRPSNSDYWDDEIHTNGGTGYAHSHSSRIA